MAETQIGRLERTGRKAFASLALALGASGLSVYSRFETASDRRRDALREWLVKE